MSEAPEFPSLYRPKCAACGVQDGTPHDEGCDAARCLETGEQRYWCGRDDHEDCGQQVYDGYWPGDRAAARAELWVQDKCSQGLGFVPCSPDAPGAMPDLNTLAIRGQWDRDKQEMVLR